MTHNKDVARPYRGQVSWTPFSWFRYVEMIPQDELQSVNIAAAVFVSRVVPSQNPSGSKLAKNSLSTKLFCARVRVRVRVRVSGAVPRPPDLRVYDSGLGPVSRF